MKHPPPKPARLAPLLTSALATLALSCALTSKGTALSPRFFAPKIADSVTPEGPRSREPVSPDEKPLELRLGTIEAASYLEERISYRVGSSELGYYDDRFWTERPEEYVRRALSTELFERRGVRRVLSGATQALDVEVTAFEELREPAPKVRLAMHVLLHDDHEATFQKSIVVERALEPDAGKVHAQRLAEAMGSALDEAVRRVGDDVVRGMTAHRAERVVVRGQE